MFEALFILTTLDAGTRVGRYLLQDFLGNIWKPLADTSNTQANILSSTLVVAGWGYFLIQGVRDPLGGINSLWPLFGIANQLLAAIALCLGTTVILKMQLKKRAAGHHSGRAHPAIALVTLVPLAWLLVVTTTAGIQKIWSPDPRIGFLALATKLNADRPALETALASAKSLGEESAITTAEKALRNNKTVAFNQYLDAVVAGTFLLMVLAIVIISLYEWARLIAGARAPDLHETNPVYLPDYAVIEGGRPLNTAAAAALAVALAKELSGEAELDRAQQQAALCCADHRQSPDQIYLQATESRYKSIRRCC
jgi:carbon starvation protein